MGLSSTIPIPQKIFFITQSIDIELLILQCKVNEKNGEMDLFYRKKYTLRFI